LNGSHPSENFSNSSNSSSSSSGLKNPVVSKFPPVQTVKPVFFKPTEEKKQEIISGIIAPKSSTIGDDEEEDDTPKRPMPKKLVLNKKFSDKLQKVFSKNTNTDLAKSVPLPPDIKLPIPTLDFSSAPPPPPPPDFDVPKKNPNNVASTLLAMTGKAHNDFFEAKEKSQGLNPNQEKVFKYIMKKIGKVDNITPEELVTLVTSVLIKTDVPDTWSKNESNTVIKTIRKTIKKYE
jgi:hypothetical protein